MKPQDLKIIEDSIRVIPDFPKPGIMFKDITTMLNNKKAYKLLIEHLVKRYKEYNLDYIAGIDARGFIFGAALASHLNLGFVPIRKKGKLPYTTVSEKYALEYGYDEVEVHIDAFKKEDNTPANVLLIDDLLATGGTASAAARLIQRVGANCTEACFIMELTFLEGAKKLDTPIYSLIKE
jgi:adenine phosphoribosyltransferase